LTQCSIIATLHRVNGASHHQTTPPKGADVVPPLCPLSQGAFFRAQPRRYLPAGESARSKNRFACTRSRRSGCCPASSHGRPAEIRPAKYSRPSPARLRRRARAAAGVRPPGRLKLFPVGLSVRPEECRAGGQGCRCGDRLGPSCGSSGEATAARSHCAGPAPARKASARRKSGLPVSGSGGIECEGSLQNPDQPVIDRQEHIDLVGDLLPVAALGGKQAVEPQPTLQHEQARHQHAGGQKWYADHARRRRCSHIPKGEWRTGSRPRTAASPRTVRRSCPD